MRDIQVNNRHLVGSKVKVQRFGLSRVVATKEERWWSKATHAARTTHEEILSDKTDEH